MACTRLDSEIDKISERLDVDGEILGSYWPKEAKYVKRNTRQYLFHLKKFQHHDLR